MLQVFVLLGSSFHVPPHFLVCFVPFVVTAGQLLALCRFMVLTRLFPSHVVVMPPAPLSVAHTYVDLTAGDTVLD